MYNALLDRLPEDYQGWLIRTDYRIGVQIQLCLSDPDLTDGEKTAAAMGLLYGRGVPDFETAVAGLSWFMNCGEEPKGGDSEPELFSFEHDAARIVSAFQKVFGRDISREKLHWFAFVPMLGDLSDTAFTSVIQIRSTAESEVDQKKRAEFRRMKQRFALPTPYSAEEQEAVQSILQRFQGAD